MLVMISSSSHQNKHVTPNIKICSSVHLPKQSYISLLVSSPQFGKLCQEIGNQ